MIRAKMLSVAAAFEARHQLQLRPPAPGWSQNREADLAQDRVGHQQQQTVFFADAAVQRHGWDAELDGDAAHRNCRESFGIRDVNRRGNDSVPSDISIRALTIATRS
jgi:hypothetical protein